MLSLKGQRPLYPRTGVGKTAFSLCQHLPSIQLQLEINAREHHTYFPDAYTGAMNSESALQTSQRALGLGRQRGLDPPKHTYTCRRADVRLRAPSDVD